MCVCVCVCVRLVPIMLKILPIILFLYAEKPTYYSIMHVDYSLITYQLLFQCLNDFDENMMQQNTYENITQIGIISQRFLYNVSMQALVDLREFDKMAFSSS